MQQLPTLARGNRFNKSKSIWLSLRGLFTSKGHMAATVKTMLVSILVLLINMLTGVLTARYLGPSGRGEQTAMVLWSQFLSFSLTFGIPSALIYNAKKYPRDEGELYVTSLVMGFGTGVIAMITGIIVLPYWLGSFSDPVVQFARLSMILCPVIAVSQVNYAAFQVRGEYKNYNTLRYLTPLTTLAALVLLIIFGAVNPYTTALAYLLPSIPIYIVMTVKLLRIYRNALKKLGQSFKRLLYYGMGSYGNDLMGHFSYYIDQILIAGMLSPAELGLYAVAVSLSRMVNVFSTSTIVVLFPKASGLAEKEAISVAFRAFRVSTTAALAASTVLMLISPYIFEWLYGPDFHKALSVFRILLLEVSISGGTMVLAQVFMAVGKPKIVTILQSIGLALVIPMILVLVPRFGLVGAGMAMLSSVLLRFAFVLFNVKFTLKTAIPRLFISGDDIRWLMGAWKSYAGKHSITPDGGSEEGRIHENSGS